MTETTTTQAPKVGDVVETLVALPLIAAGTRGIVNDVRPATGKRAEFCWVEFPGRGCQATLCWSSDLRVVGCAPMVRLDSSQSPAPTVLVVVHDPQTDSIVITGADKPGEKPTPPAIVAGILRRAAMDVAKRHGINSADGLAEVLAGSAVTDA